MCEICKENHIYLIEAPLLGSVLTDSDYIYYSSDAAWVSVGRAEKYRLCLRMNKKF